MLEWRLLVAPSVLGESKGGPGLPVHHQLPEFTQTHVHRVGDAIQPSHPLSSPSPHAFNISQNQGAFQESILRIRWPKYWSFSFSISPSNDYSGLISFRMDWLDLLAVQGTLKSLLQHCQNSWLVIESLHHQFVRSFNKYLQRIGCVPGTSLKGVCPSVNEQSLASCG